MRLALLVERFLPRAGGVEGVAWAVAHHLGLGGDEVHVFAREALPEVAQGGIRVHRLPVPAAWQPARVLAFSRAAARAAPRRAFDVVLSFSRTRHQDVYRAGGGCHASYMERRYGGFGSRWRRLSPRHAVLLGMEARIFADASQVVLCNSEMVRDEIAKRFGMAESRLAVIPNGVDLEHFRPDRRGTEGASCRAAVGAGSAPVWLLVGHGFRRKGVDTALRALAAGSQREAQLWVAGSDAPGPWRRLAERLGVGDRVRFLGPRHDPETLYAAADALLLPTRYDAFANACLEAAASGLPVVTSGANGAARWLGAAGLVVEDPEDVGGFAKALDQLADPALRREVGAAARARAETSSWQHHVTALRALFASLPR